ncbi:uncharacterized protein LOC135398488 [Ornithodoros turicata]|uniref:uncharacterized protein LOC135398488 n=1 Tax=Ornithodoros turicata TaxID=34597 RepID=UPI00313926C3
MCDICISCKSVLPADKPFVSCIECGLPYHLGKCSGITDSMCRTKKSSITESWKCQTCKVGNERSRRSLEPESQTEIYKVSLQQELHEIKQMLADLLPVRAKIDEVSATTEEVKRSIEMMSAKYDEILKVQGEHHKEIKQLEKRVSRLESTTSNERRWVEIQRTGRCPEEEQSLFEISAASVLRQLLPTSNEDMYKLKMDLNRMEQYNRQNNIEIHGVKAIPREDLFHVLDKIAEKLEIDKPTPEQIEAIHRLPAKADNIPPIIVRFVNRGTRNRWLQNRNKMRKNKIDNQDIYINENLTAQNKRLFFLARERSKLLNYRFTWQKNGTLYMRKKDGDEPVKITSELDLANLM